MYKKLESAWNSRTPVWLHNGTKENLAFQIGLAVVIIGASIAYDEVQERRRLKKLNKEDSEK